MSRSKINRVQSLVYSIQSQLSLEDSSKKERSILRKIITCKSIKLSINILAPAQYRLRRTNLTSLIVKEKVQYNPILLKMNKKETFQEYTAQSILLLQKTHIKASFHFYKKYLLKLS